MGFSVSAANFVILVSSLATLGALAVSGIEMHADVSDAREERRDANAHALASGVGYSRIAYDPATDTLTITVRNTGDVALDPDEVRLVFDGAIVTDPFTATVSGASASDAWLPGEDLVLAVTNQPGAPARIVTVSEFGVANVTAFPAGPLATVAVLPTSADVAAGATQAFDARGYDANWRRITGLTFTWSTNAGSIAATDSDSALLTAQTTAASGRLVTATSGGVSGSATVNVVAGPLDHVTVTPASAEVESSTGTQTFTAQGYDQYENAISGLAFSWSATRGSITAAGAYTAPGTAGADTVRATSGGVSGTAAVTVFAATYASTTVTDLYGGAITDVANLARDGAGDLALLDETRVDTAITQPSLANDRTFASSPVAGWTLTPVTGTFTLAHTASDGQPTANGALVLTKVNPSGGSPGSANVEYSWTQSASDSASGASLNFDYKLTGSVDATNRWVDVFLVKPDTTTVQIGSRRTDAGAWRSFGATSVAGTDLDDAGTYTLRFVGGLKGKDDALVLDNVQLDWTSHTAYRFGKELTIPSLPAGTTHVLEVRYRLATGSEGLELWTEGPSTTWTQRSTLASGSLATFTRTLTAAEIVSNAVKVRLIDVTQSGDAAAGRWEVDYVRVKTT